MPKRRFYLVCFLMALSLALALTEIRQYSRNTLGENGHWVSAKPLMQIGLVGAHHFVSTRNALAGNRLDLGAWHGYNEVYFDTALRLGSIDLSFRLDELAHLSIIFARTADSFLGVRFSRHESFPSMLFEGERSGAFTTTTPIEDSRLDPTWHKARIEAAEGHWLVSLDGEEVARLEASESPFGFVGLRNGFSRAEVDDMRIVDATGERLLDETFRHRQGYWPTLLVCLGLVYGGLLLVGRLSSRADRGGDTQPIHWVLLLSVVATFAALLYLAFDMQAWSRSYFYRRHVPTAFQGPATATLVRLEGWRQSLLGVDSGQMVEPSQDPLTSSLTRWDFSTTFTWPGPQPYHRFVGYASAAPGAPRYFSQERLTALGPATNALRILFVGSSQVVGAGAEIREDSMVSRVHSSLVDSLGEELADRQLGLEILNVAVQSSEAPILLFTFERHWLELEPDLVIINLSYNDRDLAAFEGALERFVELGRARGNETLFVVEAMAADRDDPTVRAKQTAMRNLGRNLGVPVIDLDGYLGGPGVRDSGFLWWDPVHMSAYAQHRAGTWLGEQIAPHLRALLQD